MNYDSYIDGKTYDECLDYLNRLPRRKAYTETWKGSLQDGNFEIRYSNHNTTINSIVKYLIVLNVSKEEAISMTYKEAVAYIYLFEGN